MCEYYVKLLCAGRFGLGWAHDIFLICMSYIHAYIPSFLYISIYWCVWCFSACLYFSLSLSFFRLVASWHINENPLHPRTLFILRNPLPLTLLLLLFGSVMIKPKRTFRRTSLDEAFIQNAKSSYQISPILTNPLLSTVGVRSHCVASQSCALTWSYMSFTPTCMDSILLYPSLSFAFKVCVS